MAKLRLKICKALPGYSAGQIVDVETDELGTPVDRFWRRRLADAKIDKCVVVVKPEQKPKSKKTRQEKDK